MYVAGLHLPSLNSSTGSVERVWSSAAFRGIHTRISHNQTAHLSKEMCGMIEADVTTYHRDTPFETFRGISTYQIDSWTWFLVYVVGKKVLRTLFLRKHCQLRPSEVLPTHCLPENLKMS